VGFHEKRSSFIADMHGCHVLPPRIGRLIDPLRELVSNLTLRQRMPQVEVALGDELDVLVFRVMDSLSAADETLFRAFADRWAVSIWLQPKGPESVFRFYPADGPSLSYALPDYALRLEFAPTEFTQVNPYINQVLVRRAMQLLDPQPGERILDLCSAPGGKTLAIAERLKNTGSIVAHDAHAGRLDLVRENAQRLGVTGIELQSNPEFGGPEDRFDRVLVDAPCSNTGVLRRRLELRWRIQPKEITRLAAEQLQLLRQAAQRVRPGGVLVYSTCSLEPEENEQVVEAFLRDHFGWTESARRSLHPVRTSVDGAFAAKFLRPV
jgi:23S rRNA (uracil1939-C5)-methyltransferase